MILRVVVTGVITPIGHKRKSLNDAHIMYFSLDGKAVSSKEGDEDSKDGERSGGRKRDLKKADEKQRSAAPMSRRSSCRRSRSPLRTGKLS